tara:strand:+ start:203 stop:850 length:648 start_codon:yes stop_codon:yes gene_type:complete
MAALGSQSIASSYEQLLHVDRDGGGNSTTLVDVKDGDNGTTFALKLATDKIQVNGLIDLTGGQITFPGTQSASADANTLDDYEEGTWAPAWTQGFSSTNYDFQHGKYVKVGGLICVFGSIGMTASGTTATSDALRLNLPESAVSGMNNWVGTAIVQSGAALDTESAYIRCGTAGGASAIAYFVGQADAADGQQAINGDDLGTGGTINFQITYQTT